MNNEIVIEELNTILRGTYMGIRSFEHYIQKVKDEELREHFQSMQQEVKRNAEKLAERIQNLGGIPADDEGVSGSVHSFMHKVMISDDSQKILGDAVKGLENYGVQYSEEVVKGDLDPVSKQLVEQVINTSRNQAQDLKKWLH